MTDLEQTLRKAVVAARQAAELAIDLDADLATTLQRSTHPDSEEQSAHSTRLTYLFGAAATLVVVLIGGLLMIGGRDADVDPVGPVSSEPTPTQPPSTMDVSSSTIAEQPVKPPPTNAPTDPGTSPPETSTPPATESVTVPVSYRDPPPRYTPVPFATVERPSSVDGDVQFAVGDGIIVVIGADANINVLDTATGATTQRQLAVAVAQPVFGPDNLLYGLSFTPPTGESQVPDAAIVAQPIGDDPIEVVDSVSVAANTYLELPLGTLVAGPDGIYDVDRARGKVMDYVGSRAVNLPAPALVDHEPTEDTVVRSGDGSTKWILAVEQHPNAANPFVGERPAAPGPNGTTRVVRYIGPRLETEPVDFGTPTHPVIADLQPGTGRWWSLPDDWSVAESSARGTLLVRDGDERFELAWFEPEPIGPSSSTTDAPISSTTDASNSSSPTDPESSAAEKLIGREFNARSADANDLTEIPRELGLDGNFSEYASLTLWPDAGGPPLGSVMAITPLEPGQLDPRTDIIAIVEFLSDDGATTLQSRIVDAIEVALDASEQLSMVHYGCRDEADPAAIVIGAVRVEAEAPRSQQPTKAWQVERTAIRERPVEGVVCDIVTDDGPPSE